MIREKTVLVLGAGASMPYGYPSGKTLRDQIASGKYDARLREYFDRVSREAISQFSKSFLSSQLPSIDEFLSHRGLEPIEENSEVTFEQVGKAAISLALRENRNLDYLLHNPSISDEGRRKLDLNYGDHWYQYLWKRISDEVPHDNPSELSENQITVITFNYDLSLEFYLLETCSATYGIHKQEAAAILSKIKFVHLYGALSGQPLSDKSYQVSEYSKTLDDNKWRTQLYADIRTLNVMYESRQNSSSVFDEAYEAFSIADVVCFLGFGFDPVNTQRLRISDALARRYAKYKAGSGMSSLPELFATLPNRTQHQRQLATNQVWTSAVRSSLDSSMNIPFNHLNRSVTRWLENSDFRSLALLEETGAF
jgi:hypothetical protein